MYTSIRIDLHGAQICEAVNQSRFFAELLAESITEVVRGVCGDKEDGFADTGELNGEGAGSGGLAYTAFAADKNPTEALLLYYGFESRGEVFGIGVNCSGHVGGWQ